ncbi:NUDIX hydrolase [Streptomyces sp. NPDC001155]
MPVTPTSPSPSITYDDGRYRSVIGVHLILLRDEKVLLGLRAGTGWRDGHYHVPAGTLEAGETATAGAVREAAEELELDLREEDLELVHTVHHWTGEDDPRLHLFFRVRSWSAEPVNAEPHRCAGLGWYPMADLPEPMVDFSAVALRLFPQGIAFSCVGWPELVSS